MMIHMAIQVMNDDTHDDTCDVIQMIQWRCMG